jgi:two-component sensor histidine kinase
MCFQVFVNILFDLFLVEDQIALMISAAASRARVEPTSSPIDLAILAEADHRIGNSLAMIAAMIRLQANDLSKKRGVITVTEAKRLLSETAARIDAVGRLHRRLANMSGDAALDVGEYIHEITLSLVASVDPTGGSTVAFDLRPSCLLHPRQALSLGLIVGEVVSNALKYAHPTGLPTALTVRCERNGVGLVIEITDDGVGLPEGFDFMCGGGLGSRLIRSLCDQLHATPVYENLPLGMRFTLNMPVQLD